MMHVQQADFIARHFVGLDPLNDFWIDSVTGIPDGEAYPVSALCDAESDHAFSFARLDTVNDGVFYQRLNQQSGNIAAYLFINIINNR
ncbi:hypothetical protein D3C73_1460580 [compost metagenome]